MGSNNYNIPKLRLLYISKCLSLVVIVRLLSRQSCTEISDHAIQQSLVLRPEPNALVITNLGLIKLKQ